MEGEEGQGGFTRANREQGQGRGLREEEEEHEDLDIY